MNDMIRTPPELFAHRLRTMLWIERRLAEKLLPVVLGHVHAIDLKVAIEHHIFETREHIQTLERALFLLRADAAPEESRALLGLEAEHDALMRVVDQERTDVADLMHVDVLAAAEHREIAAYETLIATANALGEDEIASMLEGIREQEEHALEVITRVGVTLLAENVESLRLDA
jgi:ferritin-like metal-binding protein YciE